MLDELSSAPAKPEKAKSKKETADESDLSKDFPTILSSVLALAFSAMAMPEEVKPNDAEISAVSYHATRILLRHIDTTKKLNADALDIIGILSTGAAWFMRVKVLTGKPEAKTEALKAAPPEAPQPLAADAKVNDPSTAAFLARSAHNAEARNE